MHYPIHSEAIPFISTAQMIEVDRAMIEDYKIELIQMMENAGRNLAHLARNRFLEGNPTRKGIVILAGPGGNGGGALVCARRLHNYGATVIVIVSREAARFKPVPAHQLDILDKMGVPILQNVNSLESWFSQNLALIIDGLIGYSLKGAPRGLSAELIHWANSQAAPILALDAPSGIDTTSGTVYNPAIKATATMTLALPKTGLTTGNVQEQIGELYLADISVPPALYRRPGLNLNVGALFATSDIIRLQ